MTEQRDLSVEGKLKLQNCQDNRVGRRSRGARVGVQAEAREGERECVCVCGGVR